MVLSSTRVGQIGMHGGRRGESQRLRRRDVETEAARWVHCSFTAQRLGWLLGVWCCGWLFGVDEWGLKVGGLKLMVLVKGDGGRGSYMVEENGGGVLVGEWKKWWSYVRWFMDYERRK